MQCSNRWRVRVPEDWLASALALAAFALAPSLLSTAAVHAPYYCSCCYCWALLIAWFLCGWVILYSAKLLSSHTRYCTSESATIFYTRKIRCFLLIDIASQIKHRFCQLYLAWWYGGRADLISASRSYKFTTTRNTLLHRGHWHYETKGFGTSSSWLEY
jgi:hypothetical protein